MARDGVRLSVSQPYPCCRACGGTCQCLAACALFAHRGFSVRNVLAAAAAASCSYSPALMHFVVRAQNPVFLLIVAPEASSACSSIPARDTYCTDARALVHSSTYLHIHLCMNMSFVRAARYATRHICYA